MTDEEAVLATNELLLRGMVSFARRLHEIIEEQEVSKICEDYYESKESGEYTGD